MIERLLLTEGARAKSVAYRGGIAYIHVHDDWYAGKYQKYVDLLRFAHPDRTFAHPAARQNVGRFFIHAKTSFEHFKKIQIKWYAIFGMKPPRVKLARASEAELTARYGAIHHLCMPFENPYQK